jgi:hypothetical protein
VKILWNVDINFPPINLYNLPMKNTKYSAACPICSKEKTYSSKKNLDKCKDKPCRACANSLSRGGKGSRKTCTCGNPKYKGSSSYCSNCLAIHSKEYHKTYYRFARYGVTKEWFNSKLGNGCAICKVELTSNKVHIDHCHSTGKVRGLLCELCNKGLGQFKDNITNLENAINYLKETI